MSEAGAGEAGPTPWSDAVRAAALIALDPAGLGGVALRAPAGPVRERWLGLVRSMAVGPVRKLPANIAEDGLLGGLDLVATLAAGAQRRTTGALAGGGVRLLAMAERWPAGTAALVSQAMDGAAAFGIVLLDEGIDEERPSPALLDRAAIHLDLTAIALSPASPMDLVAARATLPGVALDDAALEALCTTAVALGVASGRAPLLAARVARGAAALAGRVVAAPEDVALAARLVLAPRATAWPAEAPPEEEAPPPEPPPESEAPASEGRELADQVLEAAKAAIPAGLLAMLQSSAPRARTAGRAGVPVRGTRGRPVGTRPGTPRDGMRLDVLATLRAAAPWQRLRGGGVPLAIRKDDLRVTRREQKAGTTTIFLVDASGSQALNRLAEAKGAVELLLADCYVRRDQVAVLAFRGRGAELLLPPTRSLVRAKRSLAGLPGGGGTPLAAGIDAGVLLADGVRRRGGSPMLVLLTDGQANVGRDGRGGRARAREDAIGAARGARAAGVAAVLLDTAPRPGPGTRELAGAMGARYVPLPYADSASVSQTVRGLS